MNWWMLLVALFIPVVSYGLFMVLARAADKYGEERTMASVFVLMYVAWALIAGLTV